MREVCWVDARLGPAADAVCDAEGEGLWVRVSVLVFVFWRGGGTDAGDEEGILAAVRAVGFGGGCEARAEGEGVEGVCVELGIEALAFTGVGGGEAVGECWCDLGCRGVERALGGIPEI